MQMYKCSSIAVMMMTLGFNLSSIIFAIDSEPIANLMARAALVGVIAGGTADIAVIKDVKSGRSFAIKKGDAIPGIEAMKLVRVKRELAVFMSGGVEYFVRPIPGDSTETVTPIENNDDEDDERQFVKIMKAENAGFFERWYGSKLGMSAAPIIREESPPDDGYNNPPDLSNNAD